MPGDRPHNFAAEAVCALYRTMRQFEQVGTVERVENLVELLNTEARAMEIVAEYLTTGPLGAIKQRLAVQGCRDDIFTKMALDNAARDAPNPPTTPDDFRQWARGIRKAADGHQGLVGYYREQLKKVRRTARGRHPSVAMQMMLARAVKEKIGTTELARTLASMSIVPEGPGSDEPDLAMQWVTVIKAARHRQRRRVTKSR